MFPTLRHCKFGWGGMTPPVKLLWRSFTVADRRNPLNLQVALCQEEGQDSQLTATLCRMPRPVVCDFTFFSLSAASARRGTTKMHVIIVLNRISCRRTVDYCATFISRLKTDSRCEADVEQWDPSSVDMIMDDTN